MNDRKGFMEDVVLSWGLKCLVILGCMDKLMQTTAERRNGMNRGVLLTLMWKCIASILVWLK